MQETPDAAAPGLTWGVKQSFVNYVVAMSGGTATVAGGASSRESGTFFPLADQSGFDLATARGTIRFGGGVHFAGHFGALDLTLAEPWLESDEQGAVVSFETGAGRIPLVALGPAETGMDGELIVWRGIETRMLGEAAAAFNGVYGAGEPFDPMTIHILDA
jgi:hypothetical protein